MTLMTETPKVHTVYLDHAATSWPKPEGVCSEMLHAMTDLLANAGRGGYQASVDSARRLYETRQLLADLLGVRRSEDLVFVRGCTEGLNLVLKGWLQPGNRVLVSPMEHNAVMRPLAQLVRDRRISLESLPADRFGRIDLDAVRRQKGRQPPSLIVVAHASNVNGAVQDLAGLRETLPGIPLLVDAAQTAGVVPIHVTGLGINFLACSAHKGLLGPTGVGACFLDPRYPIPPLLEGGTGSHSESLDQPEARPDRYEAGTQNLHGLAGLRGALLGLPDRGLLGEAKRTLTMALIEGLEKFPVVRLQSPSDGTALCVSFSLAEMRADEVAARLEQEFGVLCRPGLQCAPAAHRHLGTFPHGTVRLSPGWKNSLEDIEVTLRGIHRLAKMV